MLYASSSHLLHTFRAIPIGELTRVGRICSMPEPFEKEIKKISIQLKQRKYLYWMLKQAIDRTT